LDIEFELEKNRKCLITYLEQMMRFDNNESVIDLVVAFCEEYNIDIEYAAEMIKMNSNYEFMIRQEAENLNYLEKVSRLPI
jgi:hypothetical protein